MANSKTRERIGGVGGQKINRRRKRDQEAREKRNKNKERRKQGASHLFFFFMCSEFLCPRFKISLE